MATDVETGTKARPLTIPQVLAAFRKPIEPVAASAGYQAAMMLIAVVMVLLPLVYVALVVAAVAGIAAYALLVIPAILAGAHTGRGTAGALVLSIGPLVAGGLLTFFMLKPLFARRGGNERVVSLDPQRESRLYAFVQKIAEMVGAPMPRRIDVTCEVNASAGFRRGLASFFGHDLVMTLGLPLAADMDARQLAGVVAHELAHFAQGFGMRSTYTVQAVNGWFARVVYERDAWDEKLVAWSRAAGRLAPIFWLARLLIWLTRKLLWVLMVLAHAANCLVLRQEEYDADRFASRLIGGEAFAGVLRRLHVLGLASHGADYDLGQAWQERRLADDLPVLILGNVRQIPPKTLAEYEQQLERMRTRMFDTHPARGDRLRALQAEGDEGVFRLDRPAADLFADFAALCRHATAEHYRAVLGPQFHPTHLVSTRSVISSQRDTDEALQCIGRHLQGLVSGARLMPFQDAPLTPPADPLKAVESLRRLREKIVQAVPAARTAMERFADGDEKIIQGIQASTLLMGGLRVPAKVFGRPMRTAEQAGSLMAEGRAAQQAVRAGLDALDGAQQKRLMMALRLLQTRGIASRMDDVDRRRDMVEQCLRTLTRLCEALGPLIDLRHDFLGFVAAAANFSGNEQNEHLVAMVQMLLRRCHGHLSRMADFLSGAEYPFEHTGRSMTLREFVVGPLPAEENWDGIAGTSEGAIDRYFSLYFRCLGQLVLAAEAVETIIGLPPLPEPPQPTEKAEKPR